MAAGANGFSPGLIYPNKVEPGDPSKCEAPGGKHCYWVDASAPSGGDGSYNSPFNSFEAVAGYEVDGTFTPGLMHGGDYLYVRGTFSASRHNETDHSMVIRLERGYMGGTPDQPTVIKSWRGSPAAIFDGENTLSDLITVRGAPDALFGAIRVQNLEVQRCSDRGLLFDHGVANVEVVNFIGHDCIGNGTSGVSGAVNFTMEDGPHNFSIRNSLIYNNQHDPNGSTNNIGGIAVLSEASAKTGSVITIHDNVIHDEIHAVRHKHSGNVTTIAYNNLIYKCTNAFYVRNFYDNELYNNAINDTRYAFYIVSENQAGNLRANIHDNTIRNGMQLISTAIGSTDYRRDLNVHDNAFYNPSAPGDAESVIELGRYARDTYDLSQWQSSNNRFYFNRSSSAFMYHQGAPSDFAAAMSALNDTTSRYDDGTMADPVESTPTVDTSAPSNPTPTTRTTDGSAPVLTLTQVNSNGALAVGCGDSVDTPCSYSQRTPFSVVGQLGGTGVSLSGARAKTSVMRLGAKGWQLHLTKSATIGQGNSFTLGFRPRSLAKNNKWAIVTTVIDKASGISVASNYEYLRITR